MHARNQHLDIDDLIERGHWEAAAAFLGSLPAGDVAWHLERVDAPCRAYLFEQLPASRWVRVYAALSPAKQNRPLARTIRKLC